MHRWEVTLLHRVAAGRRPRVAGRVTLTARDVERAQEMAEDALRERSDGDALWSLGVLRPLTPLAPGTQRYRVTFAEWVDEDDAYVRRDVHVMHVWAIDASGARRLAQEDVQRVPQLPRPVAHPRGGEGAAAGLTLGAGRLPAARRAAPGVDDLVLRDRLAGGDVVRAHAAPRRERPGPAALARAAAWPGAVSVSVMGGP